MVKLECPAFSRSLEWIQYGFSPFKLCLIHLIRNQLFLSVIPTLFSAFCTKSGFCVTPEVLGGNELTNFNFLAERHNIFVKARTTPISNENYRTLQFPMGVKPNSTIVQRLNLLLTYQEFITLSCTITKETFRECVFRLFQFD